MKKIAAFLFASLMVFSIAGCTRRTDDQIGVTSQPGGTPPTAGAGTELSASPGVDNEQSMVEVDERYGREEFSDENVAVNISLDRQSYTYSDIVGVRATVTNIGDKTIVYQKGSGSNRVPDAFGATLGSLTPLYQPEIVTHDMRYEELLPGESVTLDLPHAPYMSANPDASLPVGFDRDIEFFQTEEWSRVEPGEIEGNIRFTYLILDDGGAQAGAYDFEGENARTLEGVFRVRLVADEISPAGEIGNDTSPDEASPS